MQAFVFIVESPGPADIFDGRSEGAALAASLQIVGRPHAVRTAINREQFRRAFSLNPADGGVGLEMQRHDGAIPLIHLSMHGSEGGVGLANGDFLSWADVFTELSTLNDEIPAGLHLTLSSCHGLRAIEHKFPEGAKTPYAVIGTPELLHWADGLVAFSTFYHLWFRSSCSVEEAIQAMRDASGHHFFTMAEWERDWSPTGPSLAAAANPLPEA